MKSSQNSTLRVDFALTFDFNINHGKLIVKIIHNHCMLLDENITIPGIKTDMKYKNVFFWHHELWDWWEIDIFTWPAIYWMLKSWKRILHFSYFKKLLLIFFLVIQVCIFFYVMLDLFQIYLCSWCPIFII